MKGFIVYYTYEIVEDKAYVLLFGRLKNGESFMTRSLFKPYFYIKKEDRKQAEELRDDESLPLFEIVDEGKHNPRDFSENECLKVVLDIPRSVPEIRKRFQQDGISCYEADIRFALRFLIDHGIKAGVEIKGEHEKGELVGRIYNEPELSAVEYFPENLKTLSLDIETDLRGEEIFSVALYSDDYKMVLLAKEVGEIKDAVCYPNEKEMLLGLVQEINRFDPDIITGWNLIGFDLKIIQRRMKGFNIDFCLGRMPWRCKISIFNDFFRESRADFPGRIVLDGIHMLRMSFISLDSYKLNNAAQDLLGEKKVDIGDGIVDIGKMLSENPKKLVEYNLQDAVLVHRILSEKKIIDLAIEKSRLTGLTMDKGKASIASLDSLYLRESRKIGYVAITSVYQERGERIKGGFVMQSKSGIYDYILVLDFKSLYPSIIRTFNIDPLAFSPEGEIKAPNGARFKNNEGILPMLIQSLWEARDKAKREKNMMKSFAIKITMNSFFGVLANPNCRFYSIEMANAITHFARKIVQDTAEKVKELGYEVIYGDTDSVFVKSNSDNYEDAAKIGKKISKEINKYFDELVKSDHGRKSFLELEFEKVFKKFLMPRIRGSKVGAKKRYAGLDVDEQGQEKIKITGLEFVRSDWTEIAKEFQMGLLERLFHDKDVKKYIKRVVEEILAGKHDEKLVYRKSLTKKLDAYTKTTPPHVKAARLLFEVTDRIIRYYQTVDGPQPIQNVSAKIDYDHYIEKQIKPIADSILELKGLNFDELIEGENQKSIFDY